MSVRSSQYYLSRVALLLLALGLYAVHVSAEQRYSRSVDVVLLPAFHTIACESQSPDCYQIVRKNTQGMMDIGSEGEANAYNID